MKKETENKAVKHPKLAKFLRVARSKPFVFACVTVIFLLSLFTMFLIDKNNMYRPGSLNIPFFKGLLSFMGIESFEVNITSWLLFFIFFGLAFVGLFAYCFHKIIKDFTFKKIEKKCGEVTDKHRKIFKWSFIGGIVLLAGIFFLFLGIFFPWGKINWAVVDVKHLGNFLATLLLVIGLIAIFPLVLLVIMLLFKLFFLLTNIDIIHRPRKKGDNEDKEEGDGKGKPSLAKLDKGQTPSSDSRMNKTNLFPSLNKIDKKWGPILKHGKRSLEKEYAMLEGIAASAADRRAIAPMAQPAEGAGPVENPLKNFAYEFQAFLANKNQFYFDISILRSFIAGLNAARLILLEGLSGTGKTTLPRMFLEYVGGKTHFFAVQATWRDRSDMVGFYSEFSGQFKETQMLKRLYEASYTPNSVNLMVLDEMNISRVEYYFADFLSIFEYPSADWLVPLMNIEEDIATPKFIEDGMVKIPTNTWFVGTVNIDDSTFTITDKVYDRAIVVDFRELSLPFTSEYNDEPHPLTVYELYKMFNGAMANPDFNLTKEEREKFLKLCDFTSKTFDIQFGNRIMNQINNFLPIYVAMGGTKEEALDIMYARKILRKLDGKFESYIYEGLVKLESYLYSAFGKNTFKETELSIVKYKRKFE